MLFPLILLISSSLLTVNGAEPSTRWDDPDISVPKDFAVNGFGQGCRRQIIFKRGGARQLDQSWNYSILGLDKDGKETELNQEQIRPSSTPLSAVNSSAGNFRGAYRLFDEYALLPIQFDGCHDAVPYNSYQVKAVKEGQLDWYSPLLTTRGSWTPPEQAFNLKAIRNSNDKNKVRITWDVYQGGGARQVPGAFIIAGKSDQKDALFSQYISDGNRNVEIDIGPAAVNVTVVRYDELGSKALSNVDAAPQVQVL